MGGVVQLGFIWLRGLGLVQVEDGGCKGTKGAKGQTLEGIEASNCRKEKKFSY